MSALVREWSARLLPAQCHIWPAFPSGYRREAAQTGMNTRSATEGAAGDFRGVRDNSSRRTTRHTKQTLGSDVPVEN